jgi:hypothetical protein
MSHVWGRKNAYRILVLKTVVKEPFGRPSVDGITILNERKRSRTRRRKLDESGIGKSSGIFELGNKYTGFIKSGRFSTC